MSSSPHTLSKSLLPVIYAGADNGPLVQAALLDLEMRDTDTHNLHAHVTQDFIRARNSKFHALSFELGHALVQEQSGYRLFDYSVKHCSTSISQLTFVCRYVGLIDIAYNHPVRSSVTYRLSNLAAQLRRLAP